MEYLPQNLTELYLQKLNLHTEQRIDANPNLIQKGKYEKFGQYNFKNYRNNFIQASTITALVEGRVEKQSQSSTNEKRIAMRSPTPAENGKLTKFGKVDYLNSYRNNFIQAPSIPTSFQEKAYQEVEYIEKEYSKAQGQEVLVKFNTELNDLEIEDFRELFMKNLVDKVKANNKLNGVHFGYCGIQGRTISCKIIDPFLVEKPLNKEQTAILNELVKQASDQTLTILRTKYNHQD